LGLTVIATNGNELHHQRQGEDESEFLLSKPVLQKRRERVTKTKRERDKERDKERDTKVERHKGRETQR
jgi:hypothetical protein